MSICATVLQRGGPGDLNVLLLLFAWNTLKFAFVAAVDVSRFLLGVLRSRQHAT